jgi:restriction system protein
MSFFDAAGFEAWATRKSNDFGVDGFAIHPDGLMIIQCKRNSTDNKVGRPTIQQFKGVIEEQNALRGYVVTTSTFTEDAIESAELSDKIS